MLTLNYLKSVLFANGRAEVEDIYKKDCILESAAGYDGIIKLIESGSLPVAVVLEHNEMGNLGLHNDGGFMTASQSLWVMEMVGEREDRRRVQERCWARAKRILAVMIDHSDDAPLKQWEWGDIPYGIRNTGPNYTGYELTLHFTEDIDLSYS